MRLLYSSLLCLALAAASSAPAAVQPTVQLTVRNYTDLTNAITRFAHTVAPNETEDPIEEATQGLGLTNLATVDAQSPWEIALWYEGGESQPLLAVKVPAKDSAKFKEALSPEGLLRSQGKEWSQLENGFSMILFLRDADSLSDTEKEALKAWKAEPVRKPAALLDLSVRLSDTLREQAVGMLEMGKMVASQAVAAQSSSSTNAPNPEAAEATLNAYFGALETLVNGFQDYKLGLDLTSDALTAESTLTAKSGSDLAGWLKKPSGSITNQDLLSLINPDATVSGAAFINKSPALLKVLQQFNRLGLQMQNVDTNSQAAKDLDNLMAKMLPVAAAGSLDFKNGMGFAAAYRFPDANAAELYGQMKRLFTNSFQTLVGKDKVYSAATMKDKNEVINGVAVDRLTLTLNPDSPLTKTPGAGEELQLFFPNGKLQIDYAIQDGRLLMASPGRMKGLLEQAEAKSKPKMKLDESTCLAGYLNLLELIKQVMAVVPNVPDDAKKQMAGLDTKGTSLEFQMSLDNRMRSSLRVPLKLFNQVGKLKGD